MKIGKKVSFSARFSTVCGKVTSTCTIKVQGQKFTSEGRYYDEALEGCFVKISEHFGKAFWQILEDGELKVAK